MTSDGLFSLDVPVTFTIVPDDSRRANDVEGLGLAKVAKLVNPPPVGTFELRPDGEFDYRPPANFSGTTSFTYRLGTTTLIDQFGLSVSGAEQEIFDAFNLPRFSVLHDATIDEVLAGNSVAPFKYRAGVRVADSVVLIANFFAEQTGQPIDPMAETVFASLAARMQIDQGVTDLSDTETVTASVAQTAARLSVSVNDEEADALVAVIVESNARLDAVPAVAGGGFLEALARIEQIAQGDTQADAADGDYVATSGVLTFPPRLTRQSVDVTVSGCERTRYHSTDRYCRQ